MAQALPGWDRVDVRFQAPTDESGMAAPGLERRDGDACGRPLSGEDLERCGFDYRMIGWPDEEAVEALRKVRHPDADREKHLLFGMGVDGDARAGALDDFDRSREVGAEDDDPVGDAGGGERREDSLEHGRLTEGEKHLLLSHPA
jgi:hypothetical protein